MSTDLEQSHFDCIEITGGPGTDSMRIEVGVAEAPWCDRMVLHQVSMRASELAMQQVCDREWLLHAHWHDFGEYID